MNLQEKFAQLEERERKLLIIFGATFSVMVLVLIPLYIAMSVGQQRSENERIVEMIREIKDERVTLGRRKAESERVERRYARTAPALAGFLAKIADQVGVDIPETQDKSTVPVGKNFKERGTKIRLRGVGLLALSQFLEKVENSGYPVSVTKLNIKKRSTKPNEYDVEMDISAYDKEEKKSSKPKGAEEDGE